MIRAVIDLGTNTFNLLIAEINKDELSVEHSSKHAVNLGMGGINSGMISRDAMQRAKQALGIFAKCCTDLNVTDIQGIGTSALRAAENRDELIHYAKSDLGIPIEIISGNMEAELIYHGVKWTFSFDSPTLIMDIGGGSTEFIAADAKGIQKMTSMDIGVSRIFQNLNGPNEFSKEHIDSILSFLETNEKDFFSVISAEVMIGSSGSFETLYEVIFEKKFPDRPQSVELPMQLLMDRLDWLINASLEKRMNNKWIVTMRKHMIPITAVKVKWIIEKVGIKTVLVSPYSLKEGVFSRGL